MGNQTEGCIESNCCIMDSQALFDKQQDFHEIEFNVPIFLAMAGILQCFKLTIVQQSALQKDSSSSSGTVLCRKVSLLRMLLNIWHGIDKFLYLCLFKLLNINS